jgi:hypothetical protein
LDSELPRRVASAKAFWSLSKVLDQRDDLLTEIDGGEEGRWPRQPLLMHVWARTAKPEGLLFVENLEAFEAVCTSTVPVPPHWWILYSAGFKGASARLASGERVRWYTEVGSPRLSADELGAGVQQGKDGSCEVRFWGDLDFAGLSILRDIRRVFPQAQAWVPGYERLLVLLKAAEGHTPEESRKGGQIDPGHTGCAYADGELLSALRRVGHFVDQEAICAGRDWLTVN